MTKKITSIKQSEKGSLVISLDYELMWGMIDVAAKEGYGQTHVQQVPEVIARMIALFEKYDVHATFATVGMIMYPGTKELLADIPQVHPAYMNSKMSPYEHNYINQITKQEECLFFQPEVINEICKHKGMEMGTHTYCHYYCLAEGQTTEQFDADIKKAVEVATRNGIELKSIVFPRNQVSDKHLKICARNGITSYRGNALKYFDEPKSKLGSVKNRICRLLDAYINVGGMTSIPYDKLERKEGMLNVCASRMLRPYNPKLAFLEGLRLRRIRNEMIYAARKGEMYHLWWHPHNFGANMDENLQFLESILETYKMCKEKYGMISCTMTELSKQIS